ncbi:hypothetical protein [Flavobacterium sp.]|uniref:hypothetical protein n=1 Tax=Flavobacterium sp. TaxID=239 RepID=UPI003750A901
MTNTDINNSNGETVACIGDIQNGIDNHKKVARHLEQAAKFHMEAATHHQNGHHDRAAQSTIKAHGNLIIASELQRDNLKLHASIQPR